MKKRIRSLAAAVLAAGVLLTGCAAQFADVEPAFNSTGVRSTQTPETADIVSAQTWALHLEDSSQTLTETSEQDWAQPAPRTQPAAETETAASQTSGDTTVSITGPVTSTLTAATTAVTTATARATTAAITTTHTTTTTTTATTAVTTTTASAQPATTAAATAKPQTNAAGGAQAILNRAPLHPQITNDAELDAQVQTIFAQILTPGMSTYDKVLSCYNYLINNYEYGRKALYLAQGDLEAYEQEADAWVVLFSKQMLANGVGVCDNYSDLFLVMTRAIGLECYCIEGCTTNTKGEKKGHVWNTITVDGVDYIFDAQVEDKQSANGIQYTFFCKTYDSSIAKIYSEYDLAASKNNYNAFQRSTD